MPGLFGIPTPEEIRARIGKTATERNLNLASLPRGSGARFFAATLGDLAVRGGAKALGIKSAEEKEAEKTKAITDRIQEEAKKQGKTLAEDPVGFGILSSKMLLEEGLTEPAARALQFSDTFDRILRLPDTELTKLARQRFNISKGDPLSKEATDWIDRMMLLKNQRSGGEGTIPTASPNDKQSTETFLMNASSNGKLKIGDVPISLGDDSEDAGDFDTLADKKGFMGFVADYAKKLQADAKEANRNMAAPAARKKAMDVATKFITKDDDFFTGNEYLFDGVAAAEFLGENGTTSGSDEDEVVDFNEL